MDLGRVLAAVTDLLSLLVVAAVALPIWQRRREAGAPVFLGLLATLGLAMLYDLGDNLTELLALIVPGSGFMNWLGTMRSFWPLHDAALFLAAAFWFHFLLLYPEPRPLVRRHGWLLTIFYGPTALLALFILVRPFLPAAGQDLLAYPAQWVNQAAMLVGALAVAGGGGLLLHALLRGKQLRSRQMARDLLVGLAVALLLLAGYFVPPLLGWPILMPYLALLQSLILLVLVATLSFVVLRYQLLGASLGITRSLAYAGATVALTFAYLCLAFAGVRLLAQAPPVVPLLVTGFAFVVAILLNPLRLLFQERVDRLFYRKNYDYRQVMREFGQDLSRLQELPVFAKLILDRVVGTWEPQTAALVLRGEEGESYQVRYFYGLPKRCLGLSFSPYGEVTRRFSRLRQPLDLTREQEWTTRLPADEQSNLEALQGTLAVPLHAKDGLNGWLCLGAKRSGHPFTRDDVELLGTLADQAGVALENATLYERRRREVAALEALNRIALAATTLELDDLLEQIYREVIRLVDAPNFYIALYDVAKEEFRFAFYVEKGVRQKPEGGSRWPLGEGLTSDIVRTGEPIVTQDYVAECERRGMHPAETGRHHAGLAWLGVPMMSGPRVLGVICLSSYREGTSYRTEHVRLLSTIAAQAAVVIERAQLHDREQQQFAELETLKEIAQALGSSIHLDELLSTIYNAVRRVLDAPNFFIALYDSQEEEFTLAYYIENGAPSEPPDRRWPMGQGLSSEVVRERCPLLTEDYIAECARRGVPPELRPAGSWLGVPMIIGEEVIGVLAVSTFEEGTAYDDDDMRLLSTISAQSSSAIQNARLYESTDAALSRRIDELTAIDEIARELNATLDYQWVLEIVLERALSATSASAGLVAMRTPDGASLVPIVFRGYPDGTGHHRSSPWPVDQGIIGRVVRTAQPALIPDVHQDPDFVGAVSSSRSEIAVPIVYGGQVSGVLNLESNRLDAFDEEDLRFLQRLADHAAVATSNARLFQERERRITELAILNEIGRALSGALELNPLLETIYQQVSRLFDTTNIYIAAYDAETEQWELLLEIDEGERIGARRYDLGSGLTGYIIRSKQPLLFGTMDEIQAFEREHGIVTVGRPAYSWLGVPLIAADRVVGVMAIQSYEREHLYTEQDAALFSTIAVQAAIAIFNARLFRGVTEVRDRLQSVLDSTRDGILMLNAEGGILLVNPPIARWAGLARPEIVGMTLLQLLRRITVAHRECRRTLIDELIRSRQSLAGDPQAPLRGSFEGPAGGAQSFEWLSLPVVDQPGQQVGRIVVVRDVTEARAAERMREDLVNMIVHDLKTPLTAILLALETMLLEEGIGPLTEMQHTLTTMAQERGQYMLTMVNTLLDIRRLEAGKMPMRFSRTWLTEIVQGAVSQLEPLAREHHLNMIVEVPEELPSVRADSEKVARIFSNLLHNAIKYSYPGGVIRVRAQQQDHAILCSVVDYGVGIPKSDQDRIFEKFVQVHRPGSPRGTGLGLAFCRLTVEAHEGKIWVESEEGKGSAFYFTLPVWEGELASRSGKEK